MSLRKIISYLYSGVTFMIINIPSVKIFYSSELINIFGVIGVWSIGILRIFSLKKGYIILSKNQKKFLMVFTVMWAYLFFNTSLQKNIEMSFMSLIKYIVVILIVVGIVIFTEEEDYNRILSLQVFWGVFLTLANFGGIISLNQSLGQHYLTLGVPIAAGIVTGFGYLYLRDFKLNKNPFIILAILIMIFGVTSLNGRTPVILSFLVPLITIFYSIIFSNNFIEKIKKTFFLFIVIFTVGTLFLISVTDNWLLRFNNLLNLSEEPRYYIYNLVVNKINNNWMGYGLEEFSGLPGYPHNIFLEITLAGGIISLILFIVLLVIWIKLFIKSSKLKGEPLIIASLGLFFFLTWNISFDLISSYIPFSLLGLLINSFRRNIEENDEQLNKVT